jgi:hypothetical protein
MNNESPRCRSDAMQLLARLGAPPRLVRHVELVGEAADELIAELQRLALPFDADFVRAGVVLHDVGKTLHISELDQPGSAHEPAGEQLLLEHGVEPGLARVCRTHAAWNEPGTRLEERLIALSDKLWKGVRVRELEERVIDDVAATLGTDRWSVFTELDSLFERVAADGHVRLARSRG